MDREIRALERQILGGDDGPGPTEMLGEKLARAGERSKFLDLYARVAGIVHDLDVRKGDLPGDPAERQVAADLEDEWLRVLADFERLREDAGWPEPEEVPVRQNVDEDLRRLEREAATGDLQAQRKLEAMRGRLAPSPAPMDHALATKLKMLVLPWGKKLTSEHAYEVVFAYFLGQGWIRDTMAGYNYRNDNLLSPNLQQKVQFEKTVTHFFKGGRGKWVKDHRQPSGSTIKIAEMILSEAYRILGEGEKIGQIRERQEKQEKQRADKAWRREVGRLASRIVNVEASKLASPQERREGLVTGRPPRIDVSNAIDGEQAAEEARDIYERFARDLGGGVFAAEREVDRRFTVDHPPILFRQGINHEYRFGTDIPIVIEYDAALRFWTFHVGQLQATFSVGVYGNVRMRMFRDGTDVEEELFDALLAKYDIRRSRHSPGMPIERAENPG